LPGEVEQARVLLVSVPYALKASDADTVGGMPASAFVLAPTGSGSGAEASAPGSTKSKAAGSGVHPQFTSSGTANYIPIFTDNSGDLGNSNIYQSASGNVGIGTSNPQQRLVIGAPAGGSVLNSSNFLDQDLNLILSAPGASDKHTFFGPSTNTNLTLGVGLTEMMRINSAGNVGIGYSNPQQRLVIGAPAGGSVLNSSNLVDQDLNLILSAPGASDKHTYFGPSTPTNLTLGVGLVEMMRITNAGNVGIGYSNPQQRLVIGAPAGGRVLNASNLSDQDLNVVLTAPGASTKYAYVGPSVATNLTLGVGLAEMMRITSSGNVGIGTTAPAATLEVNGTAQFDGTVSFAGANSFTGNQTVNGNVTAINVTATQSVSGGVVNATTSFDLGGAPFSWASGSNTATGFQALYTIIAGGFGTAGGYDTAIGSSALYSELDGTDNTAIGSNALYSNSGSIGGPGFSATGDANTAIGSSALYSNTGGSGNTAIGYNALYSNMGPGRTEATGDVNTAIGSGALFYNTTGVGNTALGYNAGSAVDNTAITANYNTFVGRGSAVSNGALTNATAIGANAMVGESNALVLGSINGVNGATSGVNVGIGTATPDNLLTVNGSADKPGGGSWGTYSDRRLKTLRGSFNSGLSQILKLHPVRYRYKEENALDIQDTQEHVGLVAQDVQTVIPEAVTENSKGYLLVNNDPIIWAMLNAIKEQQTQIKAQQTQNKLQQEQIVRLTRQVKTIQATLKANGRSGSVVRTVKAEGTTVGQ